MLVLFLFYVVLVSLLSGVLGVLERRLALPGYGR